MWYKTVCFMVCSVSGVSVVSGVSGVILMSGEWFIDQGGGENGVKL